MKRDQHMKTGLCGHCGTLCRLTSKRTITGFGKVCKGCFNAYVEGVASALGRFFLKPMPLGFHPYRRC